MEINEILSAISTVGFPIVACGAMFYELHKQSENHKTEMDSLKEVINELKLAITKLSDKLEK